MISMYYQIRVLCTYIQFKYGANECNLVCLYFYDIVTGRTSHAPRGKCDKYPTTYTIV